MSSQKKVQEILKRLGDIWPNPKTELVHTNPLELLIATMLSAQTTDKVVNAVTPDLFRTYPSVEDYAHANVDDIHKYIQKVNYSATKAKHIQQMAHLLIQNFHSKVPETITELITLPGVARKTANVVMGDAFGHQDGIVVDTHVMRLSRWLGLTAQTKPEKIERELMDIVPKKDWNRFSHLLILYGRYKCSARMNAKDCPILTDLFV